MNLIKLGARHGLVAAITVFTTVFGTIQIASATDLYHVREQITVLLFNTGFAFVLRFLVFVGEGLTRGTEVVAAPAQAASDKRAEIKEAATVEAKK